MTATFDTLAASSELRTAGFTELQANALTEVIRDALRTVATKADLEKLEYRLDNRFSGMDQRLDGMDQRLDGMATKADIEKLEHGLDGMATKADIEKLEYRLNAVEKRFDSTVTKAGLELAIANLRDELKSHTNRQTVVLGVFLGLLVALLRLLG